MTAVAKYKRTSSGVQLEDVDLKMVNAFVDHVLEDHRQTPDQFVGKGRNGRTPYHRTGELIKGFFFKPASKGGRKAGLIGTIRAPADRFESAFVRDRFREYLDRVWLTRGIGWSKGGL